MLRLIRSLKKYQSGHLPLYHISVVVLFWAIADGITSFVLPIFLKQVLKDLFLVGLVFASSSVFGIMADFYYGSEQKGKTFKPYFYLSLLLALLAYVLILFANSWFIFLIVMAFWGVYYQSLNFSIVDFVGRFSKKWEHAQFSGVINMFSSLGYLIAPLIAGYMILQGRISMMAAIFFMILSGLSFLFWFSKKKVVPEPPKRKLSFAKELKIWLKVGKKSFWVLIGGYLINTWDSLVWSMGPILLLTTLGTKGAFVMACFSIPKVFLQGYAGKLADKKGKKQFVFLGILIAGIFLSLFSFGNSLLFKMFMALGSAVGVAFFLPAADGLLIDMVSDFKQDEEEIAGLRGFSYDLAYVINPIVAGLLGSVIGLPATFLFFGAFLVFGAVLIKLLWR
ncbi:MFS transporter [Patescibacteria group bacterium]